MSRRSRRAARALRNHSLEVIEARAAVSTLAPGAMMIGEGPGAPGRRPAEVRPTARNTRFADRLLVSAHWPDLAHWSIPPAVGLAAVQASPSIALPATPDPGLISLGTPDPRVGGPMIVTPQPSPADRQPGGAENPKSYGGDASPGTNGAASAGATPARQDGVGTSQYLIPMDFASAPNTIDAPSVSTTNNISAAPSFVPDTSTTVYHNWNYGPIVVTGGLSLSATENEPISGTFGTNSGPSYEDFNKNAPQYPNYTSIAFTIFWGDGQESGHFNSPSPSFIGTHTYLKGGTYTISVEASYDYAGEGFYDSSYADAYDTDTITVADPSPVVSSTPAIFVAAGTQFTGIVAIYYDSGDPSPDADGSDVAEIDWGDGQTSEGTLTSDGSGNYTVTGSNTYAAGGTFPVTVTLLDGDTEEDVTNGDPNGFQIDNTATVADAGVLASYSSAPPATLPLGDSGFEDVPFADGTCAYGPSGSAWSFGGQSGFSSTGSGISSTGSGFTYFSPAPPQGTQVAFLQGNGVISQSIAGWDGGTYTLSLSAAQRANNGVSNQDFQVLVDGVTAGTFQPSGTAYQSFTTAPFAVAAGSHTISFVGLNTVGGDNTAFIDAVGVNSADNSSTPGNFIAASDAAPFDGMVAQFTDTDPAATPDKYTTSIDFGDGEGPVEGYVLADPEVAGLFDVYGDHDFFQAGPLQGIATITETGGTLLAMNFAVNVAEAAPVAAAGTLPTIRITSRGSHPGDATPGAIPTDVEGMKYTVAQEIITPPDSTNAAGAKISYVPISLTYSYPATAVKGYGEFSTGTTGASQFLGDPRTTAQIFTVPASEQIKNMPQGNNQFTDTFFWGPEAQRPQIISVDAAFNVLTNGVQTGVVHATDSVQVNVLRPEGEIDVTDWGNEGIGIGSSEGFPTFGFDKDSILANSTVTNGIYGIKYNFSVDPMSLGGNPNGRFQMIQTVGLQWSRTYLEGGKQVTQNRTLPSGAKPATYLDGTVPYFTSGVWPVNTPEPPSTYDSPASPLLTPGSPISISREDNFVSTLMYQPDHGIYVPVDSIYWGWKAKVSFGAAAWQVTSSSKTPNPGPPVSSPTFNNSDFPIWRYTAQRTRWTNAQ